MIRIAMGGAIVAAMCGTAAAADLIVEQPVYEAAMTAAHDWSGAYLGVHGGWAFGNVDAPYADTIGGPLVDGNDPFDISGGIVGLHAGLNVQQGSFVGGVEVLADYAPISGDDNGDGGDLNGLDGQFLGTLAGRIGIATDSALFYLSGGGAVFTAEGTAPGESVGATFLGGTVGAGVELALTEDISARLDYRYYTFGQEVVSFPGAGYDIGFTPSFHSVTAGLSLAF